jgi:(p)ppGpp synthase/HD superfamily hydrolase
METVIFIREEFRNAHRAIDQRYGGLPYEVHLEQVVATAMKYIYYIPEKDRTDVLDACGSHDVIEDTLLTYKDIIKITNKRVADLVFCVTDERGHDPKEILFKTLPKIWPEPYAIFIKLCDRISNMKKSKESGHPVYKKYHDQYPIFRYALKYDDMYEDMWKELDEIAKWNPCELK